jgi:phage terminase small subunit
MSKKPTHPAAPGHLDPVATSKWQEIIEVLRARGDTLDAGTLDSAACYAAAWSRLIESEAKLKELGCVIRTAAGFAAVSPYASVQKDAARQLRQFGQALHLDKPGRRAKATEEPDQGGSLLKLLGASGRRKIG